MKRLLMFVMLLCLLAAQSASAKENDRFRLLTTPENILLVEYIRSFCDRRNVDLEVTYMGDIDCINELSMNGENYDAVWLSNSTWMYRLDSAVSVTDSKATGIVPVVVGIKPELYSENIKTVTDLLELDSKFGIASITRTDAGASAYFGIYYAMSGSPRMLTMELAREAETGERVRRYIQENSSIYNSYEDMVRMIMAGEHDYYYGYESDFIRLNKEHGTTLKLVYLEDGIPLADKPFAYVDHKDEDKKELFMQIQKHLLSNEIQQEMCQDGIRTGYGGLVPYADSNVFNPEWGIDTGKYLMPMNYPSKDVITELLNFYTYSVSRPANYVFCLDFSGSMRGVGHTELVKAMRTLFDPEISSRYFIQMKETDKVTLVLFSSEASEGMKIAFEDYQNIPQVLEDTAPGGGTNIYYALDEAIKYIVPESSGYSNYVVLLTDGKSESAGSRSFRSDYQSLAEPFPIYSITMGEADESQLEELAEWSNGKLFHGKTDLVYAFKTLRGYN